MARAAFSHSVVDCVRDVTEMKNTCDVANALLFGDPLSLRYERLRILFAVVLRVRQHCNRKACVGDWAGGPL